MEVDASRLKLDRPDYIGSEWVQVQVLRNEIVAAERLGDVIGKTGSQAE